MARQMKDSGIEWIGEIPEGWGIHTASQLFTQVKNKNEGMQEDNLLSLSYGKIIKKSINTTEGLLPESFEGYNIIEPNDIVLRLTDLQNDHTSLRVGLSEQRGIITSAYLTLRNESDCFERYLYYQLHAFDICKGFYGMGAGVRQGLNWDGIKMLKIVRPTVAEQHRIAAFLDRKCAEIDAVIERTKATIEEYKKLKQAVITEAVTKGVRGPRPMKDSGIEWIGEIPEGWEVKVAFQLFQQVKCKNEGTIEQNLLSLSYGRIKRKRIDTVGGLLPESFDGYNIIEANDIVLRLTDLQNDQTSLRVGLSHERGIVTSAYLTLRNQSDNLALYLYYYLHTFDVCKGFYGMGAGVRQGLNWDGLKLLKIVLPSFDEQCEITDYLESKTEEMDTLIAKKTALLSELETYKKSLIYEYVTGKKECPEAVEQATAAGEYPYFPAAVSTKKLRFAQAMMMAKVLDMHGKGMGRVKLEKMLYTIETSIGFDFDTEYVREAAGPLHESIYKCEGIISRQNHWYQLHQSQYGVSYTPTKDAGKYRAYYDKYFSAYNAEIERIIDIFKPYSTDQAEIVATLFAAWNDAIIDRKSFTDEDIVDDVLNNWHDNKKRFPKDVWLRAMEQMRKNNLIPKGYGKHTVMKATEM